MRSVFQGGKPIATASATQYYIAGGVRRAVAAREAGLLDIAAQIVQTGQPDVFARIPLDNLHSPKAAIPRDSRYLVLEILTKAGKSLWPIEVQPFGMPGQVSTVPLRDVLLT